jgi:hypothetical protein
VISISCQVILCWKNNKYLGVISGESVTENVMGERCGLNVTFYDLLPNSINQPKEKIKCLVLLAVAFSILPS